MIEDHPKCEESESSCAQKMPGGPHFVAVKVGVGC